MTKKNRAFLKWAGGKYSLSDVISKMLPESDRLIEPFVGAGSIFLNSDFDHYLLNDINQDLINLYKILQHSSQRYIDDVMKLFSPENNTPEAYYQFRKEFNESEDPYFRSLMFLYLNRHGYNGLCRYNKSGGYNVPFGKNKVKMLEISIEKNCPKPDIHFAQKEVTELTEPSLLKSEFLEILSTMSGTIDSLDIKLT